MKREYIVELVAQIVKDAPRTAASKTAELIVDRLIEEGVLVTGYGNRDVDAIVQKFSDTFGTTKTSRQDRWAASRLSKKYGAQAICGIIQLLADNNTEKYVPIVGSISQLETKMVSVLNFVRNLSDEEVET